MRIVLLAIIFIAFLTGLLFLNEINEASFCFLIAGTAIVALVVKGFDRLKELDLKNLKIVLADIEKAKTELAVREERFKAVLIPLVQIIAYNAAVEGRIGSSKGNKLKRQWYQKKLKMLVNTLGLESKEAKEIQKYTSKYQEFDDVFGDRSALQTTDEDYDQVKKRLKEIRNEIDNMLEQDIND